MPRKKQRDLSKAIEEVFSDPSLPLYIYFSNFNFLISDDMNKPSKSKEAINHVWRQEIQKFKKFDLEKDGSQFDKLKERIDKNPNRRALMKLDLRRYFDKNNEDDLNNLIDKQPKKSEEMQAIEQVTSELMRKHEAIKLPVEIRTKKHSMLKGPPLFIDQNETNSDGLITLHNAMNKNLFNKKNFMLTKKFYTSRNFYKPKIPGTKAQKIVERQKALTFQNKINNDDDILNDEQIDYLLEQRAHAIKYFNKNMAKINKAQPLKKNIRVHKIKGGRSQSNRSPQNMMRSTSNSTFRLNKRVIKPSINDYTNSRNSKGSFKMHTSRSHLFPKNSRRDLSNSRAFQDYNMNTTIKQSSNSRNKQFGKTSYMMNQSKNQKLGPKSVSNNHRATIGGGFFGGISAYDSNQQQRETAGDFEFEEEDFQSLRSVLNKIEEMGNQKHKNNQDYNQKTLALCHMYQKLRKSYPKPENNQLMNFKTKYTNPKGAEELDTFKNYLTSIYSDHYSELDRLVEKAKNYQDPRSMKRTQDITIGNGEVAGRHEYPETLYSSCDSSSTNSKY